MFLKNEALHLASQEIENSINKKTITDTTYESNETNLFVKREISDEQKGYEIQVNVSLKSNKNKNIVTLSAYMEK